MQIKDYVYFLTVKQAQAIAAKHENDENWDFWKDQEALAKGVAAYVVASTKQVRRAS